MDVIGWIVIGFAAGGLARLLVPGPDPMGIMGTLLLGLIGSIIGGWIVRMLSDSTGVGLVGSTAGAMIALLVYRVVSRQTSTS